MKKFLFLTLLSFSINGFAIQWELLMPKEIGIESNYGKVIYIGIDNVEKKNNLVYYWLLSDYVERHNGVHSNVLKVKTDCI